MPGCSPVSRPPEAGEEEEVARVAKSPPSACTYSSHSSVCKPRGQRQGVARSQLRRKADEPGPGDLCLGVAYRCVCPHAVKQVRTRCLHFS